MESGQAHRPSLLCLHSLGESPCLTGPSQTLQVPVTGWLEAFAAHPRIGDMSSLQKRFDGFAKFSHGEQASTAGAGQVSAAVRIKEESGSQCKAGHFEPWWHAAATSYSEG